MAKVMGPSIAIILSKKRKDDALRKKEKKGEKGQRLLEEFNETGDWEAFRGAVREAIKDEP